MEESALHPHLPFRFWKGECHKLIAYELTFFVDLGCRALESDRPASQLDSYVQIVFVSGLESCHEMIKESCIHTLRGAILQ